MNLAFRSTVCHMKMSQELSVAQRMMLASAFWLPGGGCAPRAARCPRVPGAVEVMQRDGTGLDVGPRAIFSVLPISTDTCPERTAAPRRRRVDEDLAWLEAEP
jgi:hypothetical protein